MSHKALVDTNLLIQSIAKTDEGDFLSQLFQQQNLYISSRSILEFYNVMTRPNSVLQTFSKERVFDKVRDIEIVFENHILCELPQTYQQALRICVQSKKTKKWFIFDCMLAAIALEHGINTIYTENTGDFTGIAKITVVNPFS